MISNFAPTKLQAVVTYRRSYALCDISSNNKKLIVTHVAICLSGGNRPTWGIFNFQTGKLIGTMASMQAIKEHRWYKSKVWRVMQASSTLRRVEEMTPYEQRLSEIERQVEGRRPAHVVPADSPLRTEGCAGNA